jgi:hypothetical protein
MLRKNRRAWRGGACWFACALAPAAALAQPPAARTAPAAPADVHALVDQLGDADFKAREAATEKLKELGPAALPALKEAVASSADPEVCSRADALVRRIERPRVPDDWLGADGMGAHNLGGTQVTTSVFNGQARTTVEDGSGQRKVVIVEGPAGIDLTVTGVRDGQPVAARFKARSADELREQDPDAYRVYRRWAGNNAAPFMRGRRLIMPPRAPFRILPPPEPVLQPPADDLINLEARVQRQLNQAAVPDAKQLPVRDLLRQLQQLQAEGQAVAAEDWNKQIEKYNLLSDALRDKLRDLKLPDPGDALPPPAKSRLGVSVGAADPGVVGPGADAGLTIHRVVPDSRAQRLGLKEGDVIRAVNGKTVADTGALRRAVAEAKDPLVIEVVRAGQPETVREKPAQ